MIKWVLAVLALTISWASLVHTDTRFLLGMPENDNNDVDATADLRNPVRMLHGHFRDPGRGSSSRTTIWKPNIGKEENLQEETFAIVQPEPDLIRKLLRILRYSSTDSRPMAQQPQASNDNGIVTYFEPPTKKQIIYRQCFFNPISCF